MRYYILCAVRIGCRRFVGSYRRDLHSKFIVMTFIQCIPDRSAFLQLHFLDIGDRLIEVIGLENCLHMGQVRTGLRASGRRLAQCSSIIIKTRKRFPMQIDGEPWMQPPCTVWRAHLNRDHHQIIFIHHRCCHCTGPCHHTHQDHHHHHHHYQFSHHCHFHNLSNTSSLTDVHIFVHLFSKAANSFEILTRYCSVTSTLFWFYIKSLHGTGQQ